MDSLLRDLAYAHVEGCIDRCRVCKMEICCAGSFKRVQRAGVGMTLCPHSSRM